MRAIVLSVRAQADNTMRITSVQNPAVKHCVKLRTSGSYRRQAGSVLLVGQDLVLEVAACGAAVTALVGLDGMPLPDIPAQRYVAVSEAVMAKLAGLESVSRGALAAEVALPPAADLLSLPPGSLSRVLALDGVQDPGNLGTLLRTALALGWQAAVLLPGCCDAFNDKALKASRGAAFRLPVAQLTLEQWEQLLEKQGLVALAAEPDRSAGSSSSSSGDGGDNGSLLIGSAAGGGAAATGQHLQQEQQVQQQQLLQPVEAAGSLAEAQARLAALRLCLCLGAEGQGVSAAVQRHCRSVSIPQPGEMESLNAAAAGAVLMFALSRGAVLLLASLAALPSAD
ncbi:hypothetical protein ABPG75_001269 [Micractinium tetrahymenae]